MRFPPSDRVRFEQDTLAEVICQLRFPTILAIGAQPPDAFQDAIRHEYPVYKRQGLVPEGGPPDLAAVLQQLPPPAEAITHWFESSDGGSIVSLASNFVAVTSQGYPGWEAFRLNVEKAVQALAEAYDPAYFERVGLRYRDALNRTGLGVSGQPWSALLNSTMLSLLGADPDLGIDLSKDQVRTHALLHLDDPPGAQVRLQHGVGADGGDTYEIDADFSYQGAIERGDLFDLLSNFHEQEGDLFRWAISDELYGTLGPQPYEQDPQHRDPSRGAA